MDKIKAVRFHNELDALIKKFAQEHGMDVHSGRCSFTSTGLSYNISLYETDGDGNEAMSEYAWNQMMSRANRFGLGFDPRGHKFYTNTARPKPLQIMGYDPYKKYCWSCKDPVTGSEFTCNSDYIDWNHHLG